MMLKNLYHANINGTRVIGRLLNDGKYFREYVTRLSFPVTGMVDTKENYTCTLDNKVGDYYQIIAYDSKYAYDKEFIGMINNMYNENKMITEKTKTSVKIKAKHSKYMNPFYPFGNKKK